MTRVTLPEGFLEDKKSEESFKKSSEYAQIIKNIDLYCTENFTTPKFPKLDNKTFFTSVGLNAGKFLGAVVDKGKRKLDEEKNDKEKKRLEKVLSIQDGTFDREKAIQVLGSRGIDPSAGSILLVRVKETGAIMALVFESSFDTIRCTHLFAFLLNPRKYVV